MKKYIIIAIFSILAIIILYSYITVSNGPIEPLGRLSFVKIENPDMYPGHPHSVLLAEYAEEGVQNVHWLCILLEVPTILVIIKS